MSDYAFVHEGIAYTPNRTTVRPDDVEAHNRAIEAQELDRWKTGPNVQVAYYTFPAEVTRTYRSDFRPMLACATVKTWIGTVLGTITRAHVYRHNFGGRMVAIRVQGTNGHTYTGRASYDHGDVVHLRRVRP